MPTGLAQLVNARGSPLIHKHSGGAQSERMGQIGQLRGPTWMARADNPLRAVHSEPVGQLDDVLRGQVHHAVMPAGQCIAEGAHRVRRRLAAPSSEAVHEHAVNT